MLLLALYEFPVLSIFGKCREGTGYGNDESVRSVKKSALKKVAFKEPEERMQKEVEPYEASILYEALLGGYR